MSTKGINKFEQHVEKIVFGGALVATLGIVAWQVLSGPEVKVGSSSVAPAEVDALLEKKARELSRQLSDAGIQFQAGDVPLAAPSFKDSLVQEVSPVKALVPTGPNFNGRLLGAGTAMAEQWYRVPSIPPVTMRRVLENADALTAAAATAAKDASKVIAARPDFATTDGPRDVVWTTPYAVISLKSLREELAKSDPAATPPRAAIPGVWYQETPYVVDLVFERRERTSAGGWADPVEVPVFADRSAELTFRPRLAAPPSGLREEVFALLGDDGNQREILQATFYDTVNDSFVSPSVLEAVDADEPAPKPDAADVGAARRRMQKQTELQRRQRRAEALQAEVDRLGGMWDDELEREREEERKREEKARKKAESDAANGAGGGVGGGGGLGGGSMGRGGGGQTEDDSEKDERKRNAERKAKSLLLRRLLAEIAELQKELGVQPTAAPEQQAKATPLSATDEILVWGHDLEVVPGRTYQYRCVVRVFNPFFGKGNQLVKAQDDQGIASRFTLDSVASDWSEEITVSPEVRFFVMRSTAGDGTVGSGTAQVEVYKLQGGKWRRGEMSLQPGERIGGRGGKGDASLEFTTDYVLIDILDDLDPQRIATVGATKRPALAVVAPVGGGPWEIRIPAVDSDHPDRIRLRTQADAAEGAAQAAAAAGGGNAGGGAPAGGPQG